MGRSSVHSAVLLAGVMIAISPCAASAHASSSDVAATGVYLRAYYAATRAEIKSFPAGITAVDALAKRVQAECPGALANAPKPDPGPESASTAEYVAEDVIDAAFGAAVSTERARRSRFARVVARLRWSNRVLTQLVHEKAAGEAEKATISPPNLCVDIRAWAANGYQAVSASTEHYLHLESAVSARIEGKEALIMRKLAPYESTADKRIVRKIASLEKSVFPALLTQFFAAFSKVNEALVTAVPTSGS
jgi:hypothetical protein